MISGKRQKIMAGIKQNPVFLLYLRVILMKYLYELSQRYGILKIHIEMIDGLLILEMMIG